MQESTTFKLPIEYLDTKVVHRLPDVVVNDLELVDAGNRSPMYDILLAPQHAFAKSMVQKWKTHFSSDSEFIKQSQTVLQNVVVAEPSSPVDTTSLTEIWKDLYETPNFHDRYSFIDIQHFQFVNQLSTFMGVWTIINLISPLFSIMLPLILIVAPFVLLKIQRVPITFDVYVSVLKEMAMKHAIGKAFSSMGDVSVNNLLYVLFTLAMYAIQMYQNVKSCMRFYNNISVVNKNLLTLKTFVDDSIVNFEKLFGEEPRTHEIPRVL